MCFVSVIKHLCKNNLTIYLDVKRAFDLIKKASFKIRY